MRTFSSEIPVRGFFPHLQDFASKPERIYGSNGNDIRRLGNTETRTTRYKGFQYSKQIIGNFRDYSAFPASINHTETITLTHTPWTGPSVFVAYGSSFSPFVKDYSSFFLSTYVGSSSVISGFFDTSWNLSFVEKYGCYFDTSHVPMNFNPSKSFVMTSSVRGPYDVNKFEDLANANYPSLDIGSVGSLNSVYGGSSTTIDISMSVVFNTGVITEVYLLNYADYLYVLSLSKTTYDNNTMLGRTSPEIHGMATDLGCQYWGVFVVRKPIISSMEVVSVTNMASTAFSGDTTSQIRFDSNIESGSNSNIVNDGIQHSSQVLTNRVQPFGNFGTDEINLAP